MTKKLSYLLPAVLAVMLTPLLFPAESNAELGGQVFFRYGMATLSNDRGGQVFTDTGGASGQNNGKNGWNVSAGLDVPLIRNLGPGDLIGEIMLDYARFSQNDVLQTTSALLGGTDKSDVVVSSLQVVVAPKYRFEGLAGGKIRPWIIPAGLAFIVNSPPSNDTTYLDIGYHLGAGVEYVVSKNLSLGVDYRYTIASGLPNYKGNFSTASVYLGINF